MAEQDPVQGLIDFVNDVKPFHTKIIDVLVEYVYANTMVVNVQEELRSESTIIYSNTEVTELTVPPASNFATTGTGSYFQISSPNATYWFWFNVDGNNTIPLVTTQIPIQIPISSTATNEEVAQVIVDLINTTDIIAFTAEKRPNNQLYIINQESGFVQSPPQDINTGIDFVVTVPAATPSNDDPSAAFLFLTANLQVGVDIVEIDQNFNTLTIDTLEGDVTSRFKTGTAIEIVNSTGNDGRYYVNYSSWNGTNTKVVLLTEIPSPIVDGQIADYLPGALELALRTFDANILGTDTGLSEVDLGFKEKFNIDLQIQDHLGGEWDSLEGWDPIEGWDGN